MKFILFLTKKLRLCVLGFGLLGHIATADPPATEYTYLGGVNRAYEMAVIRLALDKTKPEYGNYTLAETPHMTEARGIASVLESAYPNGIRISTYRKKYGEDPNMTIIHIPIYRGILGYRVCYVNNETIKKLEHKNLERDIRKLVHGQGEAWLDTEILRANGLKVVTGNKAENLYKMLSAQRMDLFCRGTNEIASEHKYANLYSNISLDHSIAFYYKMPFFPHINIQDKEVSSRMDKGLHIAFEDGSIEELWQQYFGQSVAESKLKHRQLISLRNPQLDDIELDIDQYLYSF